MARLYKCYGTCDVKYPKEELKKFKNQNYCEKCYDQKVIDTESYKTLLETISLVYSIPYPTGHMLRQIKNFKEDRNYSYEDQSIAILYAKNILKKDMLPKYGLGLVPYVVEDARRFYQETLAKLEEMEGKNFDYETSKIKREKFTFDKEKAVNEKMIDMNNIL